MESFPSLEVGNKSKREENSDETDNDHLRHPLLIDLVMEALFKKYSLLKHDGCTALAALAKLRGVCKTWNDEIGKMVRKQTHIDVNRILSSYPEGLGWKANTTGFSYSVPMPEKIGTFENIDLTITRCADMANSPVIKWLKMMGSTVKSLRLECPLTCYHQTRFIETILKEWCPNLKSLTLRGPLCFESLVLNSFFAKQTPLQNQCSSLKNCVLYTDYNFWYQGIESCGEKILDLETPGERQPINDIGNKIYMSHAKFVKGLLKYMNYAGEPTTTPAKEDKLLTQLVMRPIGLVSVSGMFPTSFGPHVPDFFQQQFKCDAGYETDGGVLGQLMKMSKVEKLVIHYNGFAFVNELFTMFLFRPNLWLSSLQDFEFAFRCETILNIIGTYKVLRTVFSKLGFPLKILKFNGGILDVFAASYHAETVQKILTSYADSLEYLKIKWQFLKVYSRNWFDFPYLPKLKVLVVECGRNAGFNHSMRNISIKFPMLKEFVLQHVGRTTITLFEPPTFGIFNHPLTILKLLDGYVVDGDDVGAILMTFPNLKIVDLSVFPSEENFRKFWVGIGILPLEHLKIRTDFENCQIEDKIAEFKELKSMQLVHEGAQPCVLACNFSKAFQMAPKLQFLKFTNFQVIDNEVEEFKSNLATCVVEIC